MRLPLPVSSLKPASVKKAIVVGAEKMSSIVDYQDQCHLPHLWRWCRCSAAGTYHRRVRGDGFHDAGRWSGRVHLHQKAGGSVKPASHESVDAREHFIYQEGQPVFKAAVSNMADYAVDIMKKHNMTADDIAWLVPHQANMRIIEATARRMNLDPKKVMINIEKFGNTTAATLPLCLYDYEAN
jgi:3-oxoacyl-[acyl-carrier-protein] synthase III